MTPSPFRTIIDQIVAFRDERDWKQFHTLKNLSEALSIEASEVLELLLWKDSSEVCTLLQGEQFRSRITEELGDVLIYSLLLCHEAGIEPKHAITEKLRKNRERYPIHLAKGSAEKYIDLNS